MKRVLPLVLLACGVAHAGKPKKPKLKLTSVFTPLPPSKACTAAEDGQNCPGRDDYKVLVGKAPAGVYLRVHKGELAVDLPDGTKLGPQLEWRLADGVPFAVIARVEDGDGKRYVVRGLDGYLAIGGQVDAKDKRAGKKAQELADAGYAAAKPLPDKKE